MVLREKLRALAALTDSRYVRVAGALVLVLNLGLYLSLGLLSNAHRSESWDLWVATAVLAPPMIACVVRAMRGGHRAAGAIALGTAMVAFAGGNALYVGVTQFDPTPAVPSPADIGYLLFYPGAVIAIIYLLRAEGGFDKTLWLDGLLGAAGAATALAVVLSPVLSGAGGDIGAAIVSAAFSVGDLLLIGMVAGVLAIRGLRDGSMWVWLAAGLAAFCAADVIYALQVAAGTYEIGSPWAALWPAGLTLCALALWRPERTRSPLAQARRSTAMLAIPAVATMTAVVALVLSSLEQLPAPVVVLATFTLSLAAARTLRAFAQVRSLAHAHHQAVTDELTGLSNRRGLLEAAERRLQLAADGERVALMLIDIDDFKEVNDTLGHRAGDQFLRVAASRLAAQIFPPDLIGRLGGDEFALIVTLGPGESAWQRAATHVGQATRPVTVENSFLRLEASAGIAESCRDELTVAELLRRADVAMYAAKAAGSAVEVYASKLDADKRDRAAAARDLASAIEQRQFVLHYQPKIDVSTGKVIGSEALVRWQHPTRGLLAPDDFLSTAEETGLMKALTRLVLRSAIEQTAAWRAEGLDLRVAVNLSASDLLNEQLANEILDLLDEYDVPVPALELEVTETVLMTHPQQARDMLERLHQLGLRIALDDYGVGYCTLAYLRDLPIDELKIDRSFVGGMADDRRTVAIVRSTIELAHALDLKVVAEGVEEQHALTTLSGFGCEFAQGYYFSRPLPAAQFRAFVAASASAPVPPHESAFSLS